MKRWFGVGVVSFSLAVSTLTAQDGADRAPEFDRDVQRILSDRCYQCHGPDENERQADLRLDDQESAFEDLGGYAAIVPGDPENSELIQRILTDDPDLLMPPPDSKLALTETEKQTLLSWVKAGAEWSGHWAFQQLAEVSPPEAADSNWPHGAIDQFILARLQDAGLSPSEPADKERLLRRVTLDLTGLQPTLDEIDRFLADESADAYEKLVDRLLSSEACAERLALDWMDLSRYADSHGLHADGWRRMWPWRDWVIRSFHENMPYDQFVQWQIAGDLMDNPSRDQILATAFHRNHPMTAEGGVIDEEFRLYYVFDRVETTATAFLGLTMQCARCHDHKFDPIGQKEYYQLAAFYNNVLELGMTGDDGNYGPLLALPTEEAAKELETLDKKILQLETDVDRKRQLARREFNELTEAFNEIALPEGKRFPFDSFKRPEPIESDQPAESSDGKQKASQEKDAKPKKPKPKVLDGNVEVTTRNQPELIEAIDGQGVVVNDEYGYLSIKKAGLIDTADAFTAAVWLRPDQSVTDVDPNGLRTILGTAGSKNQLWRGWEFNLDGENRLSLRLVHKLPEDLIDVRSRSPLAVSEWTHVAFTYDGSGHASGVTLYINGQPVETVIVRDALTKTIFPSQHAVDFPPDTGREMRVGRSYRAFGGEFGILFGAFDDLRLFDTALTELEMNKLVAGYGDEAIKTSEYALQRSPEDRAFEHWWTRHNDERKKLATELLELRQRRVALRSSIPEVMVLSDMAEPRTTNVLFRGEYSQPGEEVDAATPTAILPFPEDLPPNRLGLAQWLFHDENGLTSRVAVNHYWQLIFGHGLVRTPHDFGVQGERPTHPQLLDWLAVNFRDSGWDTRALLKQMVMSATYRQSSVVRPELQKKDPENRLLGRSSAYRWPAEVIRDQALQASGLLVRDVGGPSVKPYQPDGLWIEKNNFSKYLLRYKADEGDKLYRRSLYTFIRRTSPPPAMIALDATNRSVCTVKREITNTPLQALVLMNDPQFVEAARVMAERIQKEASENRADQIAYGFRVLTGRRPSDQELSILEALFEQQLTRFRDDQDSAKALLSIGKHPRDESLDPSVTAALAMLCNTIMNFDEFYMKR